ncbi:MULTISPECIES: DNA-binding response regulator [unclassified Thalassospira]|uniref:DNA-binding response regulator n=1 Tax=unclassified Thalassospira TaxID=2648997 RepID=UPI000A1E47CD|nr:DNA-binding response regulator [Thalassospira sp. MCCC 1A01428]OSQ43994.1 chemotaxis protein CheY [Thalassospira sp. MCCC 1A01428]
MKLATSGVKVAFVDDDDNLLAAHRRSLRGMSLDWEALFFNNPQQALDAISADNAIEAAVLDIHMPVMTGLELAAKLRQVRPDLIVIMLTGYADLESALEAVNEHGVYRFYPKPTPLKILLEGIAGAVEKTRGSQAHIPPAFLDIFNLGLIATDQNLVINHMNAQAAELIRRCPLIHVQADNRLALDRAPEDLDKFLYPPAGRSIPQQKGFALESDDLTVSIFLRRISDKNGEKPGFVFILVEPDSIGPPSVDNLMDVFGLTRSEARLTQKLAEGVALDEASEAVGISVQSARTYLKSIFVKTGVNRQPQLLKTVFSSIPSLRN